MEEITNLQFSDDTILCSFTMRDEFSMLKRILLCFEFVLKSKINLFKSVLVGIGCLEEVIQSLAKNISCKVKKLPILYLGLPIRAKLRVWITLIKALMSKLLVY